MEKQTFLSWLRSTADSKPKFISGATVLSGASLAIVFLYRRMPTLSIDGLRQALDSDEASWFMGGLTGLQAITCVLLVWATPRPSLIKAKARQPGTSITREAYSRIQMMVMYLYSSLSLLYVVYTFFILRGLDEPMRYWGQVGETFTATLIFYLYIEMSELTVNDEGRSESRIGKMTNVLRPNDVHRHKISFSVFAAMLILISILSFCFPSYSARSNDVQFIIRLVVACLSSVTLALVIGRLGSLYINPGTITLSLLYLYASIQPFAAFLHDKVVIFILTSLALPLKILFWLVFVWAFTTGKLWEYIQEVRDILERQEERSSEEKGPPKEEKPQRE